MITCTETELNNIIFDLSRESVAYFKGLTIQLKLDTDSKRTLQVNDMTILFIQNEIPTVASIEDALINHFKFINGVTT